MMRTVGSICIGSALLLDTLSQYKQIAKIFRVKHSNQVSSSAYMLKIVKVFFSMTGLAIYMNYVGLGMEFFMLLVYITAFIVVIKYKPKNWKLFK